MPPSRSAPTAAIEGPRRGQCRRRRPVACFPGGPSWPDPDLDSRSNRTCPTPTCARVLGTLAGGQVPVLCRDQQWPRVGRTGGAEFGNRDGDHLTDRRRSGTERGRPIGAATRVVAAALGNGADAHDRGAGRRIQPRPARNGGHGGGRVPVGDGRLRRPKSVVSIQGAVQGGRQRGIGRGRIPMLPARSPRSSRRGHGSCSVSTRPSSNSSGKTPTAFRVRRPRARAPIAPIRPRRQARPRKVARRAKNLAPTRHHRAVTPIDRRTRIRASELRPSTRSSSRFGRRTGRRTARSDYPTSSDRRSVWTMDRFDEVVPDWPRPQSLSLDGDHPRAKGCIPTGAIQRRRRSTDQRDPC